MAVLVARFDQIDAECDFFDVLQQYLLAVVPFLKFLEDHDRANVRIGLLPHGFVKVA